MEVRTQCIKVDALRKIYGKDMNLKEWMKRPDSLYVGRRGRIFIKHTTAKGSSTNIFHYPESKWANPFKVGEGKYSLDESIDLYRERVLSSNLIEQIGELEGTILGCFCDQSGKCHAKVLVELFELYQKK